MNAAKGSMEKPIAAVINELVAQRKAAHAMMEEMEPAMMADGRPHGGTRHEGRDVPDDEAAAGSTPQ